jgi:hypothetical protein
VRTRVSCYAPHQVLPPMIERRLRRMRSRRSSSHLSFFEGLPASVGDLEVDDFDRLGAGVHALALYFCEPAPDEADEHPDGEPVSVHEGFSGALRIAGEQLKRLACSWTENPLSSRERFFGLRHFLRTV